MLHTDTFPNNIPVVANVILYKVKQKYGIFAKLLLSFMSDADS